MSNTTADAGPIDSSVASPEPASWAASSQALRDFERAAEALADDGDPRALALRFVGHVAAGQARCASSNAELFEATARLLLGVAADVRRFGWVKGPTSLDAANDNSGPVSSREPLFALGAATDRG